MTDNSDYNKARTKMHELLPSVYQSETSKVLFENLFNRFLTKNETERVAGYIGVGNPDAIASRQILEPTVDRQAFQLQPILNSKIGSVENMASWQNVMNELDRLGVDITQLPQWGELLKFNWAPPINFDKLVNFQDYYWYDADSPNSRAEYITIRNRCQASKAYANFWQRLVDEYGETISISQITASVTGSPASYDQFVFEGEYTRLFEPGFQMYVTGSTNSSINKQIFEVVSLEYDNVTNITTVTMDTPVNDDTVGGGVVSLAEQLAVAIVTRECYCTGSVGWDSVQWDDNPNTATTMWDNGVEDHATWLASISNAGVPTGGSPANQMWYDTTGDDLYESDGNSWVLIISGFSATLENTTGTALWDAGDCGTGSTITTAEQWTRANKWVHKTDVPNFTIAKRADYPIIEFDADLELNEWSYTDNVWRYRAGDFADWEDSSTSPGLIELIDPFDDYTINNTGDILTLGSQYGDQTSWFTPDREFMTDGSSPIILKVVKSYLVLTPSGSPLTGDDRYHTVVEVTYNNGSPALIGSPLPALIPTETSHGDLWRGYDVHWVFDSTTSTYPVNHQVENPLLDVGTDVAYVTHTSGNYEFATGAFAQANTTLVSGTTTFELDDTLRSRALIGFDDVRVYVKTSSDVNFIRQYGTYDELSASELGIGSNTTFVAGIAFNLTTIEAGTQVRIEVGEAALSDIGWSNITVRTDEDDPLITSTVSLIKYRKNEQVKSSINQYPLFDLYNVDGTTAYTASPIFTYETSADAALVPALGIRLVYDTTIRNYGFVQYLISEDNGTLYAYRNYTNLQNTYWYNPATSTVNTWDTLLWNDKISIDSGSGTYVVSPTVGYTMPDAADVIGGLIGYLWFDTTTNMLYQRTGSGNDIDVDWIAISGISIAQYDDSLQTIWRKGLYDETYVPAKVDWQNRTQSEYDADQATYEQERADQLISEGYTGSAAQTQATVDWYASQVNTHSSTGEWVGDWEIPDPLYFNNQHENKQTVTYRELLTHFNTIISSQPKIPGYAGPMSSMYHMIPPEDINYGLGGKIKEFNDGFDTFLSSIFVNNVNPLSLIEFAHDQYESLLNSLREIYRRQLLTLFTDTSTTSLLDFSSYISDTVVTEYEQNDNASFVYGDSTTFTDVNGINDIGIRNWITTLPYFSLVTKQQPVRLVDTAIGIDEIVHHDGHIASYMFPASTIDTFSRAVTTLSDSRVDDTFGRISSSLPPSDITSFATEFNTTIENRAGVYWYYVPAVGDRVLYRLTVIDAGTETPAASMEDGTLWIDTGTNTLRIKSGSTWDVVSGLVEGDGLLNNGTGSPPDILTATTSAWQAVDFDQILNDITLSVEQKLYDNAPAFVTPPYDLEAVALINPALYDNYMEQEFLNYILELGIVAPYRNSSYATTDPWTWNYKNSTITLYPGSNNVGNESGGDWRDLYFKLYGTPYPHLEPWKLQDYTSKPTWWDEEYIDLTGTRRWDPDMWTNIFAGYIPAGRDYPNGVVSVTGIPITDSNATNRLSVPEMPTWQYVSVNTATSGSPTAVSADGGVTNYEADELLPPYWNVSVGSPAPTVRSVFATIGEIISPSADFAYGDAGSTEWDWKASSAYNYALMSAAFKLDPVRYITHTFGKEFLEVGGLQIDSDTNNTFSHTRTDFHGDIIDDAPYTVNGTNQWYVNFNRYSGFDSSYSNFRPLWTDWVAPLTYQLSSFIDTQSFILGHRNIDITSFDWNITSKRSPGVEDFWYDAFKVALLEIPPATARYDNEAQWQFELSTNLPASRTINYYDIKNYQFYANPTTDICSIYTYPVLDVDTTNHRFGIVGDQTQIATVGVTFDVIGSTGNDGNYTIISSSFDVATNTTYVVVDTVADTTIDGMLQLNYRDLPWATGDRIYLTTNETLPAPLLNETQYFIIVESDRTFKLASTAALALAGTAIDITTVGRRNHFVGQLATTFYALDGANTQISWKHFEVDRDTTLSMILPAEVSGVQNIINIVDGYETYNYDLGWRINESGELKDPVISSRNTSWQLELERFINYIFGVRTQRNRPPSIQFDISVDVTTNTFTFTDAYAEFLTGDPVMFSSDNSVLPVPLLPRIKYYVIREDLHTFKIAGSKYDANLGIEVELSNPIGSPTPVPVTLRVAPAPTRAPAITTFELNPFRNGIWFRPSGGIVSNVLTGPTEDLRSAQLLFDQYGRPLARNNIRILREDEQTHIAVADGVPNDVELTTIYNDPHNYLHLGGAHIFVDTYEHVLVFNNYTTEDQLVYDPFVGLNVTKYELQFRRQLEFTQRPNVGGYYMNTFFNQDLGLKRNIEASIEDMRYLYDTYVVPETETLILNSRKALGYDGTRDYLNNLNVGPKSQFIFWKGMIQHKGSLNAVTAFINSRRFVDAKIDEFWAYKLADFGAAGNKEYPELFITTTDARSNDIRFEFVVDDDLCQPGYAINAFDKDPCGFAFPDSGEAVLIGSDGFTPVTLTDETRWYNQPDQLETLRDNGNTLYFTLKPINDVQVEFVTSYPTSPSNNDGILILEDGVYNFYRWNAVTLEWDSHGMWDPNEFAGRLPTLRHSMKADAVEITVDIQSTGSPQLARTEVQTGLTGNDINLTHAYIPFASGIKVYKHEQVEILSITPSLNTGESSPVSFNRTTITLSGDYSSLEAGQQITLLDSNGATYAIVTIISVSVAGSPSITTITVQEDLPLIAIPETGYYYWPLNSITATSPDEGTIGGKPLTDPGVPLGSSLRLDGTGSSKVWVSNNQRLATTDMHVDFTGGFTIEAIMRPDAFDVRTTGTSAIYVGMLTNSGQNSVFTLGFDNLNGSNGDPPTVHFTLVNPGTLYYRFIDYAAAVAADARGPIAVIGETYHLLGTFDEVTGQVDLYVNGELVGSDTVTDMNTFMGYGTGYDLTDLSRLSGWRDQFFAGAPLASNGAFVTQSGAIDEVKFFPGVYMTAEQAAIQAKVLVASPSTSGPSAMSFGRELISGVDYAETLPTCESLVSNLIQVPVPLVGTDIITTTITPAVLAENVHYQLVNSEIVEFIYTDLYTGSTQDCDTNDYDITDLRVWGFTQDDNTQDPAKLIDVISKTVITNVPMWDPARDIHYHNAIHNIDLVASHDPARYNNTKLLTQPIEPGEGFTRVAPSVWTKDQVGTTWLDTHDLRYVRYYDPNAISNIDTRLGYWGRPSDWSTATVHEWMESDVPPAEWNAQAAIEENDSTLPESTRKAGRVYPQLYKTTDTGQWQRYLTGIQEYDISIEGVPVYTGSPAVLTAYDIPVSDIDNPGNIKLPAAIVIDGDADTNTFVLSGDYTSQFLIGDRFFYTDFDNIKFVAPNINPTFTISGVVYESIPNTTTITVEEDVKTSVDISIIQTGSGSPSTGDPTNEIIVDGDVYPFTELGSEITLSGMNEPSNNDTFIITGFGTTATPVTFDSTFIGDFSDDGSAWFGYVNKSLSIISATLDTIPSNGFGSFSSTLLPDGSGNSIVGLYSEPYKYGSTPNFWTPITLEIHCPGGDPGANYISSFDLGTRTYITGYAQIAQTWNASTNTRTWSWLVGPANTIMPTGATSFTLKGSGATGTPPTTTSIYVTSVSGSPTNPLIGDDEGVVPSFALTTINGTVIDGGIGYSVGDILKVNTTDSEFPTQLIVTEVGQYNANTGGAAILAAEIYTPGRCLTNQTTGFGSPAIAALTTTVVSGTGLSTGMGAKFDLTFEQRPGQATISMAPSYNGLIKSLEEGVFDLGVYINGLEATNTSLTLVTTAGSPTTNQFVLRIPENLTKPADHLTVVQPVSTGDRLQRGIDSGAYVEEYEYTSVNYNDIFGAPQTKYYFWVDNKVTRRDKRTLSPIESQRQLISNPSPYIFFQRVRSPSRATVDGYPVILPLRMSQSIIRGLRGIINADNRYVLRYTRDYTLRDSLDHGTTSLTLKNKHTEWQLIREEQPSKISRELWDRVTESIIGIKLDGSLRVPSLSRVLYDIKYETDTQYGLGREQAFANGELALEAVLAYLTDATNDFRPIDINIFFQQYSFDTVDNVTAAMNRIYTAFASTHVNKIFFSVLRDAAFSQKANYAELFKTSMIALHGVKPFQVGGLFDD